MLFRSPWSRCLVAGAAGHFLVYSKLERWYGGWCFGPRYMTDAMPLLVFFLVPLVPLLSERRALRATLALTVVLAVGVQVVGVYFWPNGAWDSTPVTVDERPERVWDWHDLQIVRTVRAGPAPTKLFQHLRGRHGGQ